jgi:hypothetical protein
MNRNRRVALGLAQHALRVMPQSRRFWAAGMANEVEHIEESGAALRWALGAVFAAYLELATSIFGATPVRILLVLPLLFAASQAIFAQCLTLAWRMHATAVCNFIGQFTPGDDYHRFIPLMERMPDWYVVLGFAAAALLLSAIVQLMRRHFSAPLLVIAAMLVETAAEAGFHLLPGYTEAAQRVWHFTNTNPMRDVWIPFAGYVLPLVLALGLWLAVRGPRDVVEGGGASPE